MEKVIIYSLTEVTERVITVGAVSVTATLVKTAIIVFVWYSVLVVSK